MMLLMVLLTSSSCLATDKVEEYQFKPLNNGYWCDDSTGRKILEVMKTRRLQLEQLQQDYNALEASYYDHIKQSKENITTLENLFSKEREQWIAEVRKSKMPGIGIFAGPAYGFVNRKVDLVIGVGVVWKIY